MSAFDFSPPPPRGRTADGSLLGKAITARQAGSFASATSPTGGSNRLYGGVTPQEALAIYREAAATHWAKKNLWFVEIIDHNPPADMGGNTLGINLFAVDVTYSLGTITGSTVTVGAAHIDRVESKEIAEVRLSTMDNAEGKVKTWFRGKVKQTAFKNGLFGVPADYCFKIRILHCKTIDDPSGAYFDEFLVRAGSGEVDLSRGDDAMQMLQLTFPQIDTFLGVSS